MQNQISKALIRYWAPGEPIPEIELQRFPYPKYIEDPLLPALTSFISTVVLLSYIYTAINTIKVISAEKEMKMKVSKHDEYDFNVILKWLMSSKPTINLIHI